MAISILKHKFNLSNPVHFIAVGFGVGLLKPAPGTWGTLLAVALYCLCFMFFQITPMAAYVAVILMCLLGVYVCDKTCKDIGEHDHGAIVWDEITGYFITILFVPATWLNVILAFVLFRLFDIVKPWPINVIDRKVHGGFGVMIDDALAGIMAGVVLLILQRPLA